MKKSEITVSMPMTAFDELEMFKQKYKELIHKLNACFNAELFNSGVENVIGFDVCAALNIARKTLNIKYANAQIKLILEK